MKNIKTYWILYLKTEEERKNKVWKQLSQNEFIALQKELGFNPRSGMCHDTVGFGVGSSIFGRVVEGNSIDEVLWEPEFVKAFNNKK